MGNGTKTAVIIVAAGRGSRAGGDLPKQWQMLGGQTVAARTLSVFAAAQRIDRIILVLHPQEMDRADAFPGVMAVPGGDTRSASVRAGLEALRDQDVGKVLIHDVARPLVTQQIISDVIDALGVHRGAAPALALPDALWRGAQGMVVGSEDRTNIFRAQTPQGFDYETILAAHRAFKGVAADDVEVARAFGVNVAMVPGDARNLKVTWAADFDRAAEIIGGEMDIRVGNGFDVHRFGDGEYVILCGVHVPHDHGLAGHSDADVAMHALTDAIYGALGEGDIGRHFPPSDDQWKGADSAIFLEHAAKLAREKGYAVNNADITIICERPKIAPFAAAMRRRLSEIIGISASRVSVKATTSERLGFTGRQEGIAAMASATLMLR